MKKNYQEISSLLNAMKNCLAKGNDEWYGKHEDRIEQIMKTAPSGSGIDAGIQLNMKASRPERLVFDFGYHPINGCGFYVVWVYFRAVVTPSLAHGYRMRITGRDRDGSLKDYLHETIGMWLDAEDRTRHEVTK